MKLEQIRIDGFGVLHDLTIDLEPDLTVIYGLNGSGKSTLLNFIRSCLYGFYQRSSIQRYEPLRGGIHGGSLCVATDQHRYLITRTQARRSSGTLAIENLDSGLSLPEAYLDELLGGISQSVFESVYAFGLTELNQLKLIDNQELNTLLYSIGLGSSISLADVNSRLVSEMDSIYKPRGRKPELNRVLEQLREITVKQREVEHVTGEYFRVIKQIETVRREVDAVRLTLNEKNKESRRIEIMLEVWPIWQDLVVTQQRLDQLPEHNLPLNGLERIEKASAELERISQACYKAAVKLGFELDLSTVNTAVYERLQSELTLLKEQHTDFELQIKVTDERCAQAEIECSDLEQQIAGIDNEAKIAAGDEYDYASRKQLFEQLKSLVIKQDQPTNIITTLVLAAGLVGWLAAALVFYSSNHDFGVWIAAGTFLLLVFVLGSVQYSRSKAVGKRGRTIRDLALKLGIQDLDRELLTFEQVLEREEALVKERERLEQNLRQLRARAAVYRNNLEDKRREEHELIQRFSELKEQYQLPSGLRLTDAEAFLEATAVLPRLLEEQNHWEQELDTIYQACGTTDHDKITMMYRVQSERETLAEKIARLEAVLQTYFGSKYSEAAALFKELDKAALVSQYDVLNGEVNSLEDKLNELQHELGRLTNQKETLEQSQKQEEYQLEKALLQAKASKLAGRWGSLKTCQWVIDEVSRKYERERQPQVLQRASRYFSAITNNRYTRVYAPLGMRELKIETAEGEILSPDQLSRGTVEQLYLALRFALAKQIAHERVKLPIFADDILVNFDRPRLLRTVKLMKELGKEHQIVLLTCHQTIADLFEPNQIRYLSQRANSAS